MYKLRQKKAFAFVFTLIFLALVVSFMAVFITAVGNGVNEANLADKSKKAYYAAEAGLADAYERVLKSTNILPNSTCTNLNNPTATSCTCPFIPAPTATCGSEPYSTTDNGVYEEGWPGEAGTTNGGYVVSLQYLSSPRTTYIITSTGNYGDVSRTLQLKIIGKTIAQYAYWSNTEINPQLGTLWWISGMSNVGPLQTNGQLNIIGNPVFDGQVSESNLPLVNGQLGANPTSNTPNYKNGTGNNPNSTTVSDPSFIFPDGLTNQAPAVLLPPAPTLGSYQTAASNSGLTLTGTSTVQFSGSNVIVTGKVVNPSNCQTTTTYNNTTLPIPAGGETIYVQSTKTIAKCNSNVSDGNVTVQDAPNQTLNGQLSVAADQNVYISGNVEYTSTAANSTNVLGLVAENNVTVIEADAPSNLTIDGVLMALTGSFDVDQYNKNPDPTGNPNAPDGAVMNQFGSMINYATGCTGEVNGNGILVDGWNQVQSYDSRLQTTLAPPGFPAQTNAQGIGQYAKEYIYECSNGNCG